MNSASATDTEYVARELRRYVAAVADHDGVTWDYVLHATSMAEAEEKAREEAGRREATLVQITAAVPLEAAVRLPGRRRFRRFRTAFLAIALAGAVVVSAVIVLAYGLGSAS